MIAQWGLKWVVVQKWLAPWQQGQGFLAATIGKINHGCRKNQQQGYRDGATT
jgi:hypothetical protein